MQAKNLGLLIGLLLLAFLSWVVSPPHIKDKIVGIGTFFTMERQCFNSHKSDFIDPYSAYEDQEYTLVTESLVKLKVRAKNRMGAYIADNVECPILDGKISKTDNLLYRLNSEKANSSGETRSGRPH